MSAAHGRLTKAELLALSDEGVIETGDFSEAEFDRLENELHLRAACLHWTGEPLKQPLATVAAIIRGIIKQRPDDENAAGGSAHA